MILYFVYFLKSSLFPTSTKIFPKTTNNRDAFTLIELIFTIVIIGILAAVAIPKLAASRSDAEAAKIANSLAVCVGDAGGAYLKKSKFSGTATTDTLPVGSIACSDERLSNKYGEKCYNITVSDSSGTMTVAENGSSRECVAAHEISRENGISKIGASNMIVF